jgi:hypothetical protein
MILAGYFTEARLGNLARLKWENIDLVERSFTFVQDKTDVKIKVLISALANAGVPAGLRKKISGHADTKSHDLYSHHEFQIIRQALEKVFSPARMSEK